MNKKETIEHLVDTLETSLVVSSCMGGDEEKVLLNYLEAINGILRSYIMEQNNTGKAPLAYIIRVYGITNALQGYYFDKKNKSPKERGLEELKVLREKEDKILSEKLPKLSNINFDEFKKAMQKVEKEIAKNKYKKKPKGIDLTELLKPYHNKDLHLAVTKDYSKVVGTGKTMEKAMKAAEDAGYKDYILMRSPDDRLGNSI